MSRFGGALRWLLCLPLVVSGPSAAERLPVSHLPAASTIRCSGNESIEVVERHIYAAGNAVEAHGNCRVRLSGVHVTAGGIAVKATGNGQVVIEGSFLQGAERAIQSTGNAEVRYRYSTVRGAISPAAGGQAIDLGGNAVEALPDPVVARLAPAATLHCGDRQRPLVLHRWIDAGVAGLEVGAGCVLTLSDSHVRAGGWGLRIADGGRAKVRNSVIESGTGGIEVAAGGHLHVAGSSIPGGLHVAEDATVIDGGGNAW